MAEMFTHQFGIKGHKAIHFLISDTSDRSLNECCCEPRFAGLGINGPGRQPIKLMIWNVAG